MKLTRERLLLAAGLASVGVGAWLLFAPGTVPGLGPLESLTDIDTATQVGLLLGLVVAVLAAFQMRRTARAALDRSDLLGPPPEQAHDAPLPAPGAPLADRYQRVRGRIGQIGRAGWHVAAYGRRARHTTDLPSGGEQSEPPGWPSYQPNGPPAPAGGQQPQRGESGRRPGSAAPRRRDGGQESGGDGQQADGRERNAAGDQQEREGQQADGRAPNAADGQPARGAGQQQPVRGSPREFRRRSQAELLALLDDIAETARDTYATATDCDEATAERAVTTGTWTDDRVAAAFLATEPDAPTFTVLERALAWLTPERTLDRRLERTLDAIEAHADGYLTYRAPSTAGTDADERAVAEGGVADDGNATAAGPAVGSVPGDDGGGGVRVEGRASGERTVGPAGATQEGGMSDRQRTDEMGETATSDGGRTDEMGETATSDGGRTTTYTARFAGFVALLGLLVAVGLVTFNPVAFAAATLPLVFLLAGLAGEPEPPGDSIAVSREITPTRPRPAERVTVTVTVENRGETTLADLRLVDSVPEALRVVEGQPRASGPLEPGATTTIEYEVIARRGRYTFGSPVARSRTVLGSMWVQESLGVEGESRIQCAVTAEDIPIEAEGNQFVGDLLASTGGEGVEFHATREYRRGDPPSRVHWRELAKRNELSTITYRERQSAEITVVADARASARTSAGQGEPAAALLAAYATYQVLAPLVGRGHRVGVAALGMEPAPGRAFPVRRIDHGRGDEQVQLALDLLRDVDAGVQEAIPGRVVRHTRAEREGDLDLRTGSPGAALLDAHAGVGVGEFVDQLAGWAASTTQFVCITPLLDAPMHGLCRRLEREHAPVVISPDVTVPVTEPPDADGRDLLRTDGVTTDAGNRFGRGTDEGVPGRALRLQRATRIETLRQHGLTVVDWHPARPLAVACENQTLPGV